MLFVRYKSLGHKILVLKEFWLKNKTSDINYLTYFNLNIVEGLACKNYGTTFSSEWDRIFSILHFSCDLFALFASSKALSIEYLPLLRLFFSQKRMRSMSWEKCKILFQKKYEKFNFILILLK